MRSLTLCRIRTSVSSLVGLLSLAFSIGLAAETAEKDSSHKKAVQTPRRVIVVAHRGAHADVPENTLAALRKAAALGCDYAEMDVRQTKDGALVLMHDSTVNRTTNGSGKIDSMTLAEVRQLRVGPKNGKSSAPETVPTFDEAVAVCRGRIKIYLDHKGGDPKAIIETLGTHKMLQDTVVYGRPDRLREFRKLRPEIKIMCGRPENRGELDKLVADLKPDILDGHHLAWSGSQVADAHRKGVEVWVDALGPLDGPVGYVLAMSIGVDAIQTDYPDRLIAWLKQSGRQP